ncbi:MAG: putative short-chain dehydrogenase, partial [Rhodospirillales bacterium]|nr:putative short-chain dehydrogenase [Rhodospirillales bacterium]
MTGRLEGRIAIVTGGGLGIGRAIALKFGQEGAKVIVGTRTATDGESAVAEIKAAGGDATLVTADVGCRAEATRLVDEAIRICGGLDVLLHNAAYCPSVRIEDLTDEDLDRTIDVNLKACFWLTQAALPALKASRQGGRILITSSISGNHAAARGLVHYSASKAGVTGFVRNLALELAKSGITVNAVEPGMIMTEKLSAPEMTPFFAAMPARVPLGRLGKGEDIAGAMAFLASNEASYITGQSLLIDGGISLP